MKSKEYYSDFLVIGSGIAGLSFAIKAAEIGSVTVLTKKKDFESNTNYAQGGIASVFSEEDSFNDHIQDTLKAGAGLCNYETVKILVQEGPQRIKELINWGMQFSLKENKKKDLDLAKEGAHSHNRILHASDYTGKKIESTLLDKASKSKNLKLLENHTAIDLLTEHHLKQKISKKNCYGAYILNNLNGIIDIFKAKVIFLATGGIGQVYLHTSNPEIATGDGIAMAYRAGAIIKDMEFIQFHPTTLYSKEASSPAFLISEAVRGEGGILLNSQGKKFMEEIHPLKDLAPRDIVARAIDHELKKRGDHYVYLDISFKDKNFLMKRFPQIYERCLKEGIDLTKEPIPVVPAAHYLCGGIVTDPNGQTSITNLFAAGESACTGAHGANRLASNSLLEALVFSHRAFIKSKENLKSKKNIPSFPTWDKKGTFDLKEWIIIQHNIEEIKRLMWNYVGIVRSDLRLSQAYQKIIFLAEEIHNYYKKSTISPKIIELRNLATIAKLIIKSARYRKNSVGLHYNLDHPELSQKPEAIILQSQQDPKVVEN